MPASPTAAIDTAINQLQAQLENLQAQVRALEEARAIVTGKPLPATKGPKRAEPQKSRPAKKKRRLSAAGREAISKAAKARWARIKAEKADAAKPSTSESLVNRCRRPPGPRPGSPR